MKEFEGTMKKEEFMSKYLSHTEYNRWFRSYLLTLERFSAQLDAMRLALDDFPGRESIEMEIDDIDAKLDEALPRNFNVEGEPLTVWELFVENIKVMVNFVYRTFHLEEPFIGIYKAEKIRVLRIHQEFKFKERFFLIRGEVESLLKRQQLAAEQAAAEQKSAEIST